MRTNMDIILIQEPWISITNVIQGMQLENFTLCFSDCGDKVRSCLLINNNLDYCFLSNYSNGDLTVAKIKTLAGFITVASVYLPSDVDEIPSGNLERLVISHRDLILGCDANAHHSQWGGKEINKRGELVFEFIVKYKLFICNRGNVPTFRNKKTEQIIDITLSSGSNKTDVQKWKVLETQDSLSDHAYISFEVSTEVEHINISRTNYRKADWERFLKLVEDNLPPVKPHVSSVEELDCAVDVLTDTLLSAGRSVSSVPKARGKKQPTWWNSEIKENLKMARRLRNKARTPLSERHFGHLTDEEKKVIQGIRWDNYRKQYRHVKYMIRRAQNESFQQYCDSVKSNNEASRLRKVLAKTSAPPGSLKSKQGDWLETNNDILEELFQTHFPGCTEMSSNTESITGQNHDMGEVPKLLSDSIISWAIMSFKPFKSPGPDGIIPAMLQYSKDIILPSLMNIFEACIRLEYVPKKWKMVRVTFIPKAGKTSHTTPKDYRPISLSSFLMKTLERILDIFIRNQLPSDRISRAQHAYTKGKSTETALHEVVSIIEDSFRKDEYVLAAFLDIEGAFNNVSSESISKAMLDVGVSIPIHNWIMQMLTTRYLQASLGTSEITKSAKRGTPQGGVLSPLLWTLVVNSILIEIGNSGVSIFAYADDVVLLVRGDYTDILSELLGRALRKLDKWSKEKGLNIHPGKTELVLFTRKYKPQPFDPPELAGQTLKLSKQAKYLGVILDSKLNWNLNVEERRKKAYNALYICMRCIGRTWGLKPKICYWIYNAIVKPILTYGCFLWWEAINRKGVRRKLGTVQRAACLFITGALRKTPTLALEAILNIDPIDLTIKAIAAKSALRLRSIDLLRTQEKGHSSILRLDWGLPVNEKTDYLIPINCFEKLYSVRLPSRNEWSEATVDNLGIAIYTDGSKMESGTGCGVYSNDLQVEKSYKIHDYCTIFQAEVLAIYKATELMLERKLCNGKIEFFVDSQSALKALDVPNTNSQLVERCKRTLNVLSLQNEVTLTWIPGHEGHIGNEKADELARKGSANGELLFEASMPQGYLVNLIDTKTSQLSSRRWAHETPVDKCKISRIMWPSVDKKRTNIILNWNRTDLRNIIGIITGHNLLACHAKKLGLLESDDCRYCYGLDVTESTPHILLECEGKNFPEKRRALFGNSPSSEIGNLNLGDLNRFFGDVMTLSLFS